MTKSLSFYIVLFTLVARLNASEQVYLPTNEPPPDQADRADTRAPAEDRPLIQTAIDSLSSLGNALTPVQKRGDGLDDKRGEPPATIVWARISRRYLADYVERAVDRKKPVQDCILGTTINGESHTTGKTHFILYPNDNLALGEVQFVGEVHATTVGRNGPATLQYLSDSTFRARKRITIGETGLRASPAIAEAPTKLTATNIQTSLPGLRGLIAERIAWRRVASSRRQADAVASDHTADDIRSDLDRKLNESVAAIQTKMQLQIAELKLAGPDALTVVRSRSTPDYIEVALCRPGASPDELRMHSIPIEGNPDIAVRVHRTVLVQVMSHPKLREKFAPLLGNGFVTVPGQTIVLSKSEPPRLTPAHVSMDGEWLLFDLMSSRRQERSLRVALEERQPDQPIR